MNNPGVGMAQLFTLTLKSRLLYLLALLCGLLTCPTRLPSAEGPANNFLIVSDIHFDPMADPALVADLVAADPTEWESILERSKLTRVSQYGEDTNWWLLRSALDQMRATLPHPAFIMVPGDLSNLSFITRIFFM